MSWRSSGSGGDECIQEVIFFFAAHVPQKIELISYTCNSFSLISFFVQAFFRNFFSEKVSFWFGVSDWLVCDGILCSYLFIVYIRRHHEYILYYSPQNSCHRTYTILDNQNPNTVTKEKKISEKTTTMDPCRRHHRRRRRRRHLHRT